MTNTPYIDALEDSNRPPKKRKTIVHAVQSAVLATSLSLGVSVDAQAQKAPDTVVATTKKPQKVKKTQKKVKKPPVSEITVPVKPKTRKVSRVRTEEMKWSYADVI
jgi:hypothetical protein